MIKAYGEPKLALGVTAIAVVFTSVYMTVGAIPWSVSTDGYGVLPTFSLGSATDNLHIFISLLAFVIAALAEGALLAFLLDQVRNIKKEFSLMNELLCFSALWLFFTNLVLFFAV